MRRGVWVPPTETKKTPRKTTPNTTPERTEENETRIRGTTAARQQRVTRHTSRTESDQWCEDLGVPRSFLRQRSSSPQPRSGVLFRSRSRKLQALEDCTPKKNQMGVIAGSRGIPALCRRKWRPTHRRRTWHSEWRQWRLCRHMQTQIRAYPGPSFSNREADRSPSLVSRPKWLQSIAAASSCSSHPCAGRRVRKAKAAGSTPRPTRKDPWRWHE